MFELPMKLDDDIVTEVVISPKMCNNYSIEVYAIAK